MSQTDQATLQRQDLSGAQRALLEKRLQHARQSVVLRADARPRIQPRAGRDRAPLSYAQERLWFLDQLAPASAVYNVFQPVRITGPLAAPVLERALNGMVERHEVFRTNFVSDEGGPVQVVAPARPLVLGQEDLSGRPTPARERELQERLQAEARRPFDLTADLLLRARLIRLGPLDHVLLLSTHHIISDGWSLGILLREIAALYQALDAGAPPPLPPLPIQYADYAAWERETLPRAALEKPLAYWQARLADLAPLELPTDHPRPAGPAALGAVQVLPVPAALTQSLKALSQREGVTLFMTLLAAFQVLLHRYTGQEDIAIGSCVAGRTQVEVEKLIGFFVNTLVLRTDLAGNPTFRELLARTRETALGAIAHQDLPFEKLVAELQPDRSLARNPFFQVMFVLQSATGAPPEAAGLRFEPLELDNGTAKFDLTLSVAETPAGLRASLEYRTDLFEPATINRLLGHFRTLLEAAALAPDSRLATLPLLTEPERRQLLTKWNGRRTAYPRDRSIGALFLEQARQAPARIAVTDGHRTLTYAQLNESANRLAHHLRRSGAQPGAFVGVCHERSIDLIVALLAILKAGCTYVSLDPAYPAARLAFMVADTHAPILLTQEKLRSTVNAALGDPGNGVHRATIVVSLDASAAAIAAESGAEPPDTAAADALAYVSYTSGTSGRPKGVGIPHRGVVRLVRDTDYADFGPDETFLQFAPVAFDASTLEIWGPLLNGGRLAVFPPGPASLTELGTFVQAQGVTTLWLTAGLFHQMIGERAESLRGVRQLLAGGDVLSPPHVARALAELPGLKLINGYGPTENTTFTCCHRITAPPAPGRSVPIGRPVANTEVYLLDAGLQPVPVGVPGNLYAGGDGLARGYLNQPALTTEKFIPHPFDRTPGARLYRTGDRARWLPDGTIEFLGRADRQLKIRGFRIEPDEIEAALAQHPAVRQAVVLAPARDEGERRLVAYVVAHRAGTVTPAALRVHAQQWLPEHMVPSAFVLLDHLPLNPNGKVDHAALPAPASAVAPDAAPVAPRDAIEAQLAAIWEKVLGVSPVGVHDNFFTLGGHSLAGVRLFAQIERTFGRKLPLASLFQFPTVEQLARRLHPAAAGPDCSSLVTLQAQGSRPPVFFVHGAGLGNLWTYANLVPHLGTDQPVYALESRAMRGQEEFDRLEDMAAHYLQEIRTVQPHGPYYLGGYCFGGNVAYEMARQLDAQGETVALLALLDSAAANSSYQRIPWWQPAFYLRFAANTFYWLRDFLDLPAPERHRFMRRKARILSRKLLRSFRRRPAGADDLDVEEVIDFGLFSAPELRLWKVHLNAFWQYRPAPYRGRATLFRTRGQPFLCSFDPHFGWDRLVTGGVEIVPVTGTHEKIFLEPHVRALCAQLRASLDRAQAAHPGSATSLS